jgi:hypothetical protein
VATNGPIIHPPVSNHGEKISKGEHSQFVHHSSLQILQAETSRSEAEGTGETIMKFACKVSLSYFEGFFNMM